MTSPRLLQELQQLRDIAEPVYAAAGVPWAVCVGQAWAESGLGRSDLAQRANNFHGIKYRKGQHDRFVMHVSPERTRKGNTTKQRMRFAAFDTPEDGIRAWVKKVTSRRYRRSSDYETDPVRFMAYLWGKGWATANHYVESFSARLRKLGRIIGDEDLAGARVDHQLEPCLEVLRECGPGSDRHKLTDWLAQYGLVWDRVPTMDL